MRNFLKKYYIFQIQKTKKIKKIKKLSEKIKKTLSKQILIKKKDSLEEKKSQKISKIA